MNWYDELLQYVLSGISTGSIYVIVGLGFTLIYVLTRVINFAQGEFVMLGGMLTAVFYDQGISVPLSLLIAVAMTTVVGLIMQRLVIYPARRSATIILILLTFGFGMVIRTASLMIFGSFPEIYPPFTGSEPIHLLGATIAPQSLWVIGITALIVVGLYLFLEYTLPGKAFRACSIDKLAAGIMGVNPENVSLLAFGLAAGLGALAGAVLTPITSTSYDIGTMLSIKGFVAALIGGLNRIEGVVLGGILLGVLESLGAGYISSGYKDAIPLIAFLVVLYFRRHGLIGGAEAGKV